jgi:flagellar biosynthesis protein FliR
MSTMLISDFVILFLIFVRIVSAFVSAPIFSNSALPIVPKIFIAFVIAYVIFSMTDKTKVIVDLGTWFLVSNVVKEAIAGLLIGYALNMVFYGISFAGSLIGFEVGLSAAEMFNPIEENQTNVIGEAIYFAAMLIFLLINGHHYLIRALYTSFSIVPIGKYVVNKPVFDILMKYTASVFVIAVKIASPILVSYFLINIAEGIVAKVIPQMQVFFVTQPLKLGLGFAMLAMVIPTYVYVIKGLLRSYEESLFQLIKAMS